MKSAWHSRLPYVVHLTEASCCFTTSPGLACLIRSSGAQELRGVEALVRWNSPERGLVSPQEFIPIAEETGLIIEIGICVLRQACNDMQALNTRLGRSLCVSVNISPNQLMCPEFVHQVKDILNQSGMQPGSLELELTEGAFIHDMNASTVAMQQLKELGVLLAVDDFGTGHAGIEYLRKFPIDIVKLIVRSSPLFLRSLTVSNF